MMLKSISQIIHIDVRSISIILLAKFSFCLPSSCLCNSVCACVSSNGYSMWVLFSTLTPFLIILLAIHTLIYVCNTVSWIKFSVPIFNWILFKKRLWLMKHMKHIESTNFREKKTFTTKFSIGCHWFSSIPFICFVFLMPICVSVFVCAILFHVNHLGLFFLENRFATLTKMNNIQWDILLFPRGIILSRVFERNCCIMTIASVSAYSQTKCRFDETKKKTKIIVDSQWHNIQ